MINTKEILYSMSNLFNKDYYENGIELGISGYSNYNWIPELTMPFCHELIIQLNIKREDIIVDYGCAKGFLVKAFKMFHYKCFGLDISKYAINSCPVEIRDCLFQIQKGENILDFFNKKIDIIIAKDVLEHIPYEDLDETLFNMRKSSKRLFAIIPLGENNKFVIPNFEKDITHIIRENKDWWDNKFIENNFEIISSLYYMPFMKEHWSHFEKGIGFFLLK